MKRLPPALLRASFAAAAGLLSCVTFLFAQQVAQGGSQGDASIQTTTQERVESEPWWPTKSTFPLKAYAGSQACMECHADQAPAHSTSMQRAAIPAGESKFLAANPHSSTSFAPFAWTLAGQDFTVTHGSKSLTAPIAWDIGAGDLAHTFLYQHEGRWFQSQVTYYTRAHALDTTTGFNTLGDADIETALGQKLTGEEVRKCFSCHTVHATTSAGFNPEHAEPGLGCEACHGPGREHVESMKSAGSHPQPAAPGPRNLFKDAIFNPAGLSPVDAIDYCGSCHRTSVDATLAGPTSLGTAAVRFQPYRLQQSKCWRSTQSEKLTCTACHNPHEPLDKSPVAYDKTCVSCHTRVNDAPAHTHALKLASATPATGASTSCVSCHMPRVEVSSMHGTFTDHRIRITHPHEPFPD